MHDLIDFLARKQLVWLGKDKRPSIETLTTGHILLDNKLQGGFPRNGVITVDTTCGIGELRFLLPYLLQEKRLTVFINPPGIPCAEFLHHQGVNLQHVLVIYPKNKNDALWAAEQCLKSGACSAVLLWQNMVEVHHIKRLQLACDTGSSTQFLFRQQDRNVLSLPVALSLKLRPHPKGIEVEIQKRKGGWPISAFSLDMTTLWPDLTLDQPGGQIIPFPKTKVV